MHRHLIDISDLNNKRNRRLWSFIHILVDLYIDGDFSIRRWMLNSGEGAEKGMPTFLNIPNMQVRSAAALLRPENSDEPLSLSSGDELVFADYYFYEPGWGWSMSDYEIIRQDDIVFSSQSWVRRAAIASQGLTPQTSIFVLASAGIEFIVPNVIIKYPFSHELHKAIRKTE